MTIGWGGRNYGHHVITTSVHFSQVLFWNFFDTFFLLIWKLRTVLDLEYFQPNFAFTAGDVSLIDIKLNQIILKYLLNIYFQLKDLQPWYFQMKGSILSLLLEKRAHAFLEVMICQKIFLGFSVFSLAVAPSIQSLVWQMYHSWRRAQAIQIRGFYHQTLSLRKFFFSLCQINWLTMQHFRTKDWSHDSPS